MAPPHASAEVANAIFRRLRFGEIDEEEARRRADRFTATPIRLVHPRGLIQRAIELGREFSWETPYDALYLAVGELIDCDVWTADGDFHRDAHRAYPRLRLLSDFAS